MVAFQILVDSEDVAFGEVLPHEVVPIQPLFQLQPPRSRPCRHTFPQLLLRTASSVRNYYLVARSDIVLPGIGLFALFGVVQFVVVIPQWVVQSDLYLLLPVAFDQDLLLLGHAPVGLHI